MIKFILIIAILRLSVFMLIGCGSEIDQSIDAAYLMYPSQCYVDQAEFANASEIISQTTRFKVSEITLTAEIDEDEDGIYDECQNYKQSNQAQVISIQDEEIETFQN
ncbi:MAG: hypothetical protein ABIA04_05205 [Pseudomonadota bacterium]